ncbi:MAG: hypothetical protein IKP53_08390 [Candidatus Methanomethylophilaceae archaeon]|nr:hypothetical protein [Candidatus Methanomethylophilaceae archaeon]
MAGMDTDRLLPFWRIVPSHFHVRDARHSSRASSSASMKSLASWGEVKKGAPGRSFSPGMM